MDWAKRAFLTLILVAPGLGPAWANEEEELCRELPLSVVRSRCKDKNCVERWWTEAGYYLSNSQHIQWAKDRCGLSRERYWREFVVEGDGKAEDSIGRASLPEGTSGEPLYILIGGNFQTIEPDNGSGMAHIYEQMVEAGKPVMWLRSGDLLDEFGNLQYNGEYSDETEVIHQHIHNISEEAIRRHKPSEVRIAGYSWGGTSVLKLSKEQGWRGKTPVTRTVMIDAINQRKRWMGSAQRDRPDFGPGHTHYHVYQRKSGNYDLRRAWRIEGNAPRLVRAGDKVWKVPNTTHAGEKGIFRDKLVRARVLHYLVGKS